MASLVDLPPTILDLAGIPAPSTFAGTSLVPLLRGEPPGAGQQVFGEQLWGPRQTALRDGTYTWIETASGTSLFHVASDPWERTDRAAEDPVTTRRGADAIADFRRRCDLQKKDLGRAPVALDPERLRAREALGYVQ